MILLESKGVASERSLGLVFCLTMDQIPIKTPNPKVGFSEKLSSKGTWRQVFICLRPLIPPPPGYTLHEYPITLYLFTQRR
jgi:hypothetical protein